MPGAKLASARGTPSIAAHAVSPAIVVRNATLPRPDGPSARDTASTLPSDIADPRMFDPQLSAAERRKLDPPAARGGVAGAGSVDGRVVSVLICASGDVPAS